MGKENIIRTNTNVVPKLLGNELGFASYISSLSSPSSAAPYGVITSVNNETKEVTYKVIDNKTGVNKTGTAKPINSDKMSVPQTGSIVPLTKGPDKDNTNNNSTYYHDPVGNQQTVDNNTTQIKKSKTSAKTNIKNKIPNNQPKQSTNNSFLRGNYIVSKNLTNNIWSVVYGGIASLGGGKYSASMYGASYMKQQAEGAGVSKLKNFIFSDYTNDISSITGMIQKQYPGAIINSVICYSRSGQEVWYLVGKYNFVGFMDPSTSSVQSDPNNKTCENPNIRMIYNPSNWDGYPNIKKALTIVGERMKKRKTATQTSAGHFAIPQMFFKTYINLF